jgi:hypothetical protein
MLGDNFRAPIERRRSRRFFCGLSPRVPIVIFSGQDSLVCSGLGFALASRYFELLARDDAP